jgi:hypothetical protein
MEILMNRPLKVLLMAAAIASITLSAHATPEQGLTYYGQLVERYRAEAATPEEALARLPSIEFMQKVSPGRESYHVDMLRQDRELAGKNGSIPLEREEELARTLANGDCSFAGTLAFTNILGYLAPRGGWTRKKVGDLGQEIESFLEHCRANES